MTPTIVEDGDRKGNQSTKRIQAKVESKIKAMTLLPRTPSLMPLDFSIWQKVVEKVIAGAPKKGTESKDAFLSRLRRCAMTLPKGTVKKAIGRMKDNIQAILDANPAGYLPKND